MAREVRWIPAVLAACFAAAVECGRRRTGWGLRSGCRDRQCAGQFPTCLERSEGPRGNRGVAGDAGLTGVVLETGDGRDA